MAEYRNFAEPETGVFGTLFRLRSRFLVQLNHRTLRRTLFPLHSGRG